MPRQPANLRSPRTRPAPEVQPDLAERLFALMMLGDERCVVATHVMGEKVAGP